MGNLSLSVIPLVLAKTGSRRGVIAALGGLLAVFNGSVVDAMYSDACTRFRLTGGRRRDSKIAVDDRLVVFLGGNKIWDTGPNAGDFGPFDFYARKGMTLGLAAYDNYEPKYELSALYLHCIAGGTGKRRLTDRKRGRSRKRLPNVFLGKTFTI